MRFPSSYNDLTISQFQECYFILGKVPQIEQWITVLSILSGKPEDYFNEMPIKKLKGYIAKLQFLLNPKLNTKGKKYVYANGRIYKAILNANEITTAQGIDLKTFQKPAEGQSIEESVIENAHKLLACIYVPLVGFKFRYDGKYHPRTVEDLKKVKVGDVFGTLFFYSNLFGPLTETFNHYGEKALNLVEEHMKEVAEWMQKNPSEIIGAGK